MKENQRRKTFSRMEISSTVSDTMLKKKKKVKNNEGPQKSLGIGDQVWSPGRCRPHLIEQFQDSGRNLRPMAKESAVGGL